MSRRYLLSGPFRLDLVDERLTRDGEAVPLGSRPLALLRAFMERPRTLLTKDELTARVWPGLAVSESILTTAIKDLRRALGDDARHPAIIGTVHGRGYRFMLPVEAEDPESAGTSSASRKASRRWVVGGALTGLAAISVLGVATLRRREPVAAGGGKSVAVLPFTDLSQGGDQGWFAEGLTEEVINGLARTSDLRVTSQQAATRFREGDRDPRRVAREIGVANLLEGSVRRSGERVRVTVKLVRVSDGAHVWTQTYDRQGQDVISIQADIAFDIARALKTVIEPTKLRAMVEAGTRSVDAYEAYLRGLALERRESVDGDGRFLRAAGEAYEQARRLDPRFADAHWRAAQIWFGNGTSINPTGYPEIGQAQRLAAALERLDQAIASSPNEVDRLKYASMAAWMRLRLRPAQRLMARYLEARPRDLDAWTMMADLSAYAGEWEWFKRSSERIHTLSMLDGLPRSRALAAPFMYEDYRMAYQRARQHLASQPGDVMTYYQAHRAYIGANRIAEARDLLKRISSSRIPLSSRLLAEQRQACAEGRTADAAALRAKIDATGEFGARWISMQMMGDNAEADALLKPLDTPTGLPTLMQFMIYPSFDVAAYPTLATHLKREGIPVRRPVAIPFSCVPAT